MENENGKKGIAAYWGRAKKLTADRKKLTELIQKALAKSNGEKNVLGNAWSQLQLLVQLVRSWMKGEYKDIPMRSIITAVACLIYFVAPADLIPDFILGLGYVDDTAVLAFTFRQIAKDIDDFRVWQETNRSPKEEESFE
ncbi:YkvA family protein [Bacillus sp. 1P06AnD]|uniref:YkvA family protein n=1 Tax=Bacillus sp. 1P06AnD TaxID=3132208 RepID=UPI00399F0327